MTAPLSLRSKLSYGLGDFGFGLSWNLIGAFLLLFYTDVALLPAAAAGTLLLASRLLDAGFDPVVGLMVDRTRSRWGRTRPYFLFGAIPFAILCVATFWSPPVGEAGRIVWAAASFVVVGLLFSLINIPYNALMPMMTLARDERLQLSGLRAAGTAASVIVATAATMPLVSYFGGGSQARGFVIVIGIFAGITALSTLNLFFSCREAVAEPDDNEAPAVLPAIALMFRNRTWLVVFAFAFLNFVRFGAVLAVTAFFAINVLRQPWMISILLPAVSGTLLIGAAIAPPYMRRLGIRRANLLALVVALGLYVLLPFVEAAPKLFLAVYVSASIVLSLTMTAIFAMAAEAVDDHERLFGVRQEGLLSAGITLALKVGMALGGAIIAYGLAAAAYDPRAVTEGARGMMRILYYGPAYVTIVLQIVVNAFYRPGVSVRPALDPQTA